MVHAKDEFAAPITQGEPLNCLELDQLRIVRASYRPEVELRRHLHERASIALATSGRYVERLDATDYEMEPGSVLLKPAGTVHEDRFGPRGAHSMIVSLPMTQADELLWGTPAVRSINHFTDGLVTELGVRIHRELEGPDDLTALVIDGLVRELVGIATRRDDHGPHTAPPWLRRVHERIQDEFTENLTVRELAEEAGVHPDHLSRRFKADYGIVIGEFVRRLRVDRAAEALATTDRPISRIAHATGFVDQSHLTRTFKKYLGLTPARFRQRVRDE